MTRTPIVRAGLEGSVLLAAIGTTVVSRSAGAHSDWTDAAGFLGQALVLTLCCIVSSYHSGLYDPRTVRKVTQFVSRLPLAIGLTVILLIGCYALLPRAKMTGDAFEASVITIALALWPLRALGHRIVR